MKFFLMECDFVNISVYMVQQEAHQNQAHSESEKRRGDLGELW